MTRQEQQTLDRRYADWRKVYVEELHKSRYWGDQHKTPERGNTEQGEDTL